MAYPFKFSNLASTLYQNKCEKQSITYKRTDDNTMQKKIYHAVILLLCILCCYFYYQMERAKIIQTDNALTAGLESMDTTAPGKAVAIEQEDVTFYICGEIFKEGTYTLPAGSRIQDGVNAGGGFTENAFPEAMESLAKEIVDGQKIYVPNITDDIDKIQYLSENRSGISTEKFASDRQPDFVVNINTADAEELTLISGIGEATAQAIINHRNENGSFQSPEEIQNVPRIGAKTYENIKDYISVN